MPQPMPFLLFMPSYNQAHFIVEAVRSVLAQDDRDWELWIVDNSSDDTPKLMGQFPDERIRFHHIPERMDPGTCLNWMLARASGRDFSYVHTDNNLHPSYVRRMRAALAAHPLSLAYCDMRTINQSGTRVNVIRRGAYDLPRLLSADSLGVPFAATIELAKKVGGFGARDLADDVRFCVSAYGIGKFIYIPDALLDYRLHASSRTEIAGGSREIERILVSVMPKVFPLLEARGIPTLDVLAEAIASALNEANLLLEDICYRQLSAVVPWWKSEPTVDDFFFNGLLDVEGFSNRLGRPPLQGKPWRAGAQSKIPIWNLWRAKVAFFQARRQLRVPLRRARSLLLALAHVRMITVAEGADRIRISKIDFVTVWAARQLQLAFKFQPVVDASIAAIPTWLGWQRAQGDEPLLDCGERIDIRLDHGAINNQSSATAGTLG